MRHHKKAGSRYAAKADVLAEEMAKILSTDVQLDVRSLFERVLPAIQARGSGKQAKDALRLSLYDKLTRFVAEGMVRKEDRLYSGDKKALAGFLEKERRMEEERLSRKKRRAAAQYDGSESESGRQP